MVLRFRIFAVLASALLVGAVALGTLAPPDITLGQALAELSPAGYDHTAQPLSRLGLDGADAADEHRTNCAGHAVVVTTEWSGTGRIWVAKPVCQDPVANGHTVPDWVKREMRSPGAGKLTARGSAPTAKKKIADMDPEDAEQARAERKEIRDNNLAWQSAVVVRRDWLATQFATRTAVPSVRSNRLPCHGHSMQPSTT